MNELLQILQLKIGVFLTGIGIFTSVNALFFNADNYFSGKFRDDVSSWLSNIETKKNYSWSLYFSKLFDAFFKKNTSYGDYSEFKLSNYTTMHCFYRSCIASTLAIVISTMVGMTLGPLSQIRLEYIDINAYYFLLFSMFLMNFLTDYISLIQTRYFISFLEKKESIIRVILFYILDFICTTLLFITLGLMILLVILWLVAYFESGKAITGNKLFNMYKSFIYGWDYIFWLNKGSLSDGKSIAYTLGVFGYSTFLTSVWIWLFGISNFFIKIFSLSYPMIKLTKYILPINEKPFRSIGIFSSVLATLAYWLFSIFQI